jgi:heme A synthase
MFPKTPPAPVSEGFSRILFREMIHRSWGGQVTFLFPDTLADVRKLA